ncbi:hypothetical protein [Streptomyces sp. NPDC055140]
MATDAGSEPLAPRLSGTGRPVPELDSVCVEQWRTEGGELVSLLTQALKQLGGVAALRLGPHPTVLVTEPGAVQHVLALHPDMPQLLPREAVEQASEDDAVGIVERGLADLALQDEQLVPQRQYFDVLLPVTHRHQARARRWSSR